MKFHSLNGGLPQTTEMWELWRNKVACYATLYRKIWYGILLYFIEKCVIPSTLLLLPRSWSHYRYRCRTEFLFVIWTSLRRLKRILLINRTQIWSGLPCRISIQIRPRRRSNTSNCVFWISAMSKWSCRKYYRSWKIPHDCLLWYRCVMDALDTTTCHLSYSISSCDRPKTFS